MSFSGYRAVWAIPHARSVLLLGLVCRAPMLGAMVLLTLHVVERLDPRYSAAGVVSMAATIAVGISGPWRGRLLDRQGLRKTLLPSLLILPVCWSIAPWSPYWLLLILVTIAGLYAVPIFALVRQTLLGVVQPEQRRAALALDSVLAEIAFMSGPALAIWVSTIWGTAWTLFMFQYLSVAGGLLLFVVDPPLRGGDALAPVARLGTWVSPAALGILGLTVFTTVSLTATDLAVVAGLRALDHPTSIGWVLALWGLGSAVGGLLFGVLARPLPPWLVVAALGATTMPVFLARSDVAMAGWLVVAGFFCAPALTATSEALSRVVAPSVRGEAFGWHGTALTSGSALSAPIIGVSIDTWGWGAGFYVGGGLTLLAAMAIGAALRLRPRRATDPKPAGLGPRASSP